MLRRAPEQELRALAAVAAAAGQMVAARLHNAQVFALEAAAGAGDGAHRYGALGGDEHDAHVVQQGRRVAQHRLPAAVLAAALQAPAGCAGRRWLSSDVSSSCVGHEAAFQLCGLACGGGHFACTKA